MLEKPDLHALPCWKPGLFSHDLPYRELESNNSLTSLLLYKRLTNYGKTDIVAKSPEAVPADSDAK
jgi:hypothetical protein